MDLERRKYTRARRNTTRLHNMYPKLGHPVDTSYESAKAATSELRRPKFEKEQLNLVNYLPANVTALLFFPQAIKGK